MGIFVNLMNCLTTERFLKQHFWSLNISGYRYGVRSLFYLLLTPANKFISINMLYVRKEKIVRIQYCHVGDSLYFILPLQINKEKAIKDTVRTNPLKPKWSLRIF